jgi:hypothetical protein
MRDPLHSVHDRARGYLRIAFFPVKRGPCVLLEARIDPA